MVEADAKHEDTSSAASSGSEEIFDSAIATTLTRQTSRKAPGFSADEDEMTSCDERQTKWPPQYIGYFEQQQADLCGMHALNNAIGQPLHRREDMQQACDEYILRAHQEGLPEVRAMHERFSGWYSSEVMALAVTQTPLVRLGRVQHIMQLEPLFVNPVAIQSSIGAVVNIGNIHWVALRWVHGSVWLLDSLEQRPVPKKWCEYLAFIDKHRDAYRVEVAPDIAAAKRPFQARSGALHSPKVAAEEMARQIISAPTTEAERSMAANRVPEKPRAVRLRRKNDTFYDDYLHRGSREYVGKDNEIDTPMKDMSFYEYGMHVQIVAGDPWALRPNQYAFEEHHAKFETHVQELREAPAIPFIHGFSMPTESKDRETNACFKQLLLRPHRCNGPEHCCKVDVTADFLEECKTRKRTCDPYGVPEVDDRLKPRFEVVVEHTYVRPWRRFEAEQQCLAQAADAKIHAGRKYPVLQDVTLLRRWWLEGSLQGTSVHHDIVPSLHKVLPTKLVWKVLRLAGHVRDAKNNCVIGIVNTSMELRALQVSTGLGDELRFTSPGTHDDQLTIEEFFAWRRVHCADWLEQAASARGRPRPGVAHPDAIADDPDGVQCGGAERPEDARFDHEDALPGGDCNTSDEEVPFGLADPELNYAAKYAVRDDHVFDIVHRFSDLEKQMRNARSPQKQALCQAFMRQHELAYQDARRPHVLTPRSPLRAYTEETKREHANALQKQTELLKARAEQSAQAGIVKKPILCGHGNGTEVKASILSLGTDELPASPIEKATEYIARSGVWKNREQYLTALFVLQPLQKAWERARREGAVDKLKEPGGVLTYASDLPVRRVFLHGPGGSGKTWVMTEVVIPVVKHFLGERGVKAMAAHNSAARLLMGQTMHSAGKMLREQSLKAKDLRPKSHARKALETEWMDPLLLLGDEISLAAPPLLAGVSRRAFHGRMRLLRLEPEKILEHPFGDVPLQVFMGDFMQLNPIQNHSLLETFCSSRVSGVPKDTFDEDRDGYKIFRQCCQNVVLFTGTHRFLDRDLPMLLNIMRTPGGRSVPVGLKEKIAARLQAGEQDPRYSKDYVLEGQEGFFAFGAHAAITWEQVIRTLHLRVLQLARRSRGPRALYNKPDGTPDRCSVPMDQPPGQLVYYFQRVDKFKHPQDREVHMEALRFVKLSKSAGLHGMLGLYVGMRVRLTKKILSPEIVQEATGEVINVVFHHQERFGHPASTPLRPSDLHECWTRGWVKCDRLPLYVEVRWDGCTEDYTGLGKPGVWHLVPKENDWKFPIEKRITIDHPGAPRPMAVKQNAKSQKILEVTSCQIPLTHEDVMTLQNAQGKTIRGPEKQPKGFVLDLYKPQNMSKDEYFQHVYMGLGRAQKLEWLLLRNFPTTKEGDLDWALFEEDPPAYLLEFMQVLEQRARSTIPRMLRCQRELGLPAFENIRPCLQDPESEGRFLYNPKDWEVSGCRVGTAPQDGAHPPEKKRRSFQAGATLTAGAGKGARSRKRTYGEARRAGDGDAAAGAP